jgi:hypothetical protein
VDDTERSARACHRKKYKNQLVRKPKKRTANGREARVDVTMEKRKNKKQKRKNKRKRGEELR